MGIGMWMAPRDGLVCFDAWLVVRTFGDGVIPLADTHTHTVSMVVLGNTL